MTTDSEFEKWYKEKYYKYDLYPKYAQFRKEMKEVWQAAKADSASEIAELKAKIKDLEIQNVLYKDDELEANIAIAELQAHINVLREALEFYGSKFRYSSSWSSNYNRHVMEDKGKLAQQALATTPAQSLIQHDNEVKEVKCKTHPDAPHGFNRNESHNAGRYVCDCEFWEEK